MGKAILVPNITFSSNLGKVTCSEWPYNAIELKAQSGMVGSGQGSAVYGDLLFGGYKDNAQIRIYNLQTHTTAQTLTVPDSAVTGRHMNSLCFGHLKYDNADEYPLLYGGGNLDALKTTIDIYRVTQSEGVFSIVRIGALDTSVFGTYVDVAYWNDKLVICGGKIYIVNPPAATETEYVFTQDDIIARYERGTVRTYIQQPCVHNDYLYIPYLNTSTSKGAYDFMMKVMDLNTGNIVMNSEFNYNNNYNIEFESVITWNSNLYIVNNTSGYSVNLCRV